MIHHFHRDTLEWLFYLCFNICTAIILYDYYDTCAKDNPLTNDVVINIKNVIYSRLCIIYSIFESGLTVICNAYENIHMFLYGL